MRGYAVRGIKQPGGRFWNGKLDLWLAEDEAATPVELFIARRGAKVRLELVDEPASD